MLYDTIKIVHILSASILLGGIINCAWAFAFSKENAALLMQTKTLSIVMPFGLLQLFSGFTMISLKHYSLSEIWIKGSMVGFIILMVSWIGFLFVEIKRWRQFFLSICVMTLLVMIFLMANKI